MVILTLPYQILEMLKGCVSFASWGCVYFASRGKIKYMVLHGQIRTGSDWWFSKTLCGSGLHRNQLLRIRIGLGLKNFPVRSSLQWTSTIGKFVTLARAPYTYIGLHHLPHEEKQTLPVKLQNDFNFFKLQRYSLLLCAKQAFSVSVTIYQNKIYVFAVALIDTQAKIPLKHCFHQHSLHPLLALCQSFMQFCKLYVFRTCCNWALVMWCTICFTNYRISSQHGKVTMCWFKLHSPWILH